VEKHELFSTVEKLVDGCSDREQNLLLYYVMGGLAVSDDPYCVTVLNWIKERAEKFER
jgi:hypothetical protein